MVQGAGTGGTFHKCALFCEIGVDAGLSNGRTPEGWDRGDGVLGQVTGKVLAQT